MPTPTVPYRNALARYDAQRQQLEALLIESLDPTQSMQDHAEKIEELNQLYDETLAHYHTTFSAKLRYLLSWLDTSLGRGFLTASYASIQLLFVIYTIIFCAGTIFCDIDYESPYTMLLLLVATMIAVPGVIGQLQAFPTYIHLALADEKMKRPEFRLQRTAIWQNFNNFATRVSLFANGWNLLEQLSLMWYGNDYSKSYMQCIGQYWSAGLNYSWRIPGAMLMFVLQHGHVKYYYGSDQQKAEIPLFNFTTVAASYAFGALLMTLMPSIRFFDQQKQQKGFSIQNSQDLSMIIHIVVAIVVMIPLRTLMYRGLYQHNHDEAKARLNTDVPDDDVPLLGPEVEADLVQQATKKQWMMDLVRGLKLLGIANVSSYQYYMTALGSQAVVKDLYGEIDDTFVSAAVQSFIISISTGAAGASWLRYVLMLKVLEPKPKRLALPTIEVLDSQA